MKLRPLALLVMVKSLAAPGVLLTTVRRAQSRR